MIVHENEPFWKWEYVGPRYMTFWSISYQRWVLRKNGVTGTWHAPRTWEFA